MGLSLKRPAQFQGREPRLALRVDTHMLLPGHDDIVPVAIKNVSVNGFMGETAGAAELKRGTSFGLSLPECGIVRAIVCWNEGGEIGCQFRRPVALERLGDWVEATAPWSAAPAKANFAPATSVKIGRSPALTLPIAEAVLQTHVAQDPSVLPARFHILSAHARNQAEQAHFLAGLGHHAEVFSHVEELIQFAPNQGIVLAEDSLTEPGIPALIERLERAGIALPVVALATDPKLPNVVSAMSAGALDYLQLPLSADVFASRVNHIVAAATKYMADRRRLHAARDRITCLTPREIEVLELFSNGRSNDQISSHLGISKRTVEVHRKNLIAKLETGHSIGAVRLWIEAAMDQSMS